MRDVTIHPTAIVDAEAKIGAGTTIGPYSIIGKHVEIGEKCEIQEHVVLRGHTSLGNGVKVFPMAVIGGEPQHTGYQDEPTRVEVGDETVIREGVTIHRGTAFGNGVTRVGRKVLLMAHSHVAHDCVVGDECILANTVLMAGHSQLGRGVVVGGVTGIVQFCRVGDYAYIGGHSSIRKDVPPYLLAKGSILKVQGVNLVGLKRRNFSEEAIRSLRNVYKMFYLQNTTMSRAIEEALTAYPDSPEVRNFVDFVKQSKVGLER